MASNSFGNHFRITTWGESHGSSVGVIIDGCPPGIEISEEKIFESLVKRRPGNTSYTSLRKEQDVPHILSGVFENKTTGAPISILIQNGDVDSSSYETLKNLLRPGHASYTYLEKYGIFDYRGGGRASARETAARVAAGAVAREILEKCGIKTLAYLKQIGNISADCNLSFEDIVEKRNNSFLFCPDATAEEKMKKLLEDLIQDGDSIGGVVSLIAKNVPAGLGDPVYEKLEANLAKAMLSIPASKGFEIGEGFSSVYLKGSEHNDEFVMQEGKITTRSNHSGGILGGISTGSPIYLNVAFKPTSSIKKTQKTVTLDGKQEDFLIPKEARHDPSIAIRAVPVVEAMANLVLVDALLMNQSIKLASGALV